MPSSDGSANGSSGDTLPANGSTLENGSTGSGSVMGGVFVEGHGDELPELVGRTVLGAASEAVVSVWRRCGRGLGRGAMVVSTTGQLEDSACVTATCCLAGTDTGTETTTATCIGAKGSTGRELGTGLERERLGGGGGGTSSTERSFPEAGSEMPRISCCFCKSLETGMFLGGNGGGVASSEGKTSENFSASLTLI